MSERTDVPAEDDSRSDLAGLARRGFLGMAGAAAFGAMTTGASADDGDAPLEHDHSGAHGAATNLGESAPVESIVVDDLVTTQTPMVDVTAYGVVGDGETDDAAAFQRAADAATPHGVLYVPSDVTLHFESTVEIDLSEQLHNRFAFICHGALNPGSNLGKAIHMHGGMGTYVDIRLDGGGADVESDTAMYVTDCRLGLFEGFAKDYNGRVYEFENSSTYSVGDLKTWHVGQSVAVFDASPMGEIRDVFDVSPVRAPEFHDSSDVCINQYENYMDPVETERGLRFENCLSVWLDTVAVGGTTENPPAEFRGCDHMFVNALHLGGSETYGAIIEDVTYSTVRAFCNVNTVGIKYAGSASDGNRVVVNGQNIDEMGLVVDSDVSGGYHYFTGNFVGTTALGVDVRTSDAEVHLDNLYAVDNGQGDLRVVPDNQVHLTNSRVGVSEGRPKTINGVGAEEGNRERPKLSNWKVGHRVKFTDTGDGSGSGFYEKTSEGAWFKHGGEMVVVNANNTL